jgi:predicted phage terminase large subunit-like protein
MPAHPERAATIDGLTPAEIAEIETIDAELAGGGESLIEFIERIAPDHAPVPRHLLPLIKVIERARRERVKVCLSMPPGHAKTLTLLRGIAWWLAATPSDTCAYLSYADRQAWGKSKIGRDIAEEAGVELNPYAWSGAEWRTTDGGGVLGRLARKGGWEVINLPALAEPNDSLGREPGEALWPEMYDEREFAEIREEIGEFDFGALYQGRPIPRGATLFGLEHYYDQEKVDLTGCKIIMACDEAARDDTVADNSTIVVMAMKGRGIETIAYILDVYCEQVTIPQFARDLRAWQVRWGNPRCGVESNGAFKAVPQLLKEADASLRIKEIVALVDKFQRAQSVSAAWNNARVLVPLPTASRPVPWLKRFLGEVSVFTGVSDAHDDQVDALAHAWNMAYQPGATGGATKRDGAILPRRI